MSHPTYHDLLEALENYDGLVNTPLGRRQIPGEFADEVRKTGSAAIKGARARIAEEIKILFSDQPA